MSFQVYSDLRMVVGPCLVLFQVLNYLRDSLREPQTSVISSPYQVFYSKSKPPVSKPSSGPKGDPEPEQKTTCLPSFNILNLSFWTMRALPSRCLLILSWIRLEGPSIKLYLQAQLLVPKFSSRSKFLVYWDGHGCQGCDRQRIRCRWILLSSNIIHFFV